MPVTQADRSRLRKRVLGAGSDALGRQSSGQIVVGDCATVAYSSEDPAHPLENLFDDRDGPGGTYWASARSDVTEHLIVEFDEPRSLSRLAYEVEETRRGKTQQVRIEVSDDAGRTWRQLLAQDYTFSPQGATFQREDLRLEVTAISHLRVTIVPNKGGSGRATLTSLRLFGPTIADGT